MNCRICRAASVRSAGGVEYYAGYAWSIFDCPNCSCRFTRHDESIHQWLHQQANSSYGLYRELLDRFKPLFDQGDLGLLRRELCLASKYRFVIEAIDHSPKQARILEVGCSRGYLTSYSIQAGRDILGSDVSTEAIRAAIEAFGDFFAIAGEPIIRARAPYDIIYHVGTIGCVGDPVALTRSLLELLKPGGQLLFNAPNADACWLEGQLWLDAAPPPDVVTLFRPGFWSRQFGTVAMVTEEVEMCGPEQSFVVGLRKFCGRHWHKPTPIPLDKGVNDFKGGRNGNGDRSVTWKQFERCSRAAARITGANRLTPGQPSPFGLFVTMTKK